MKIAIWQGAPVPLAVGRGIDEACKQVRKAIDAGVSLLAFGETFLGGYPLWLDAAPGAALWDARGTKVLHRLLLEQALVDGDPRLEALQALVDASGMLVSIGAHFRQRSSLYNDQLLLRPALPPLHHFKLVPTHSERLIWARGDGSTLKPHRDAHLGTVGSLICWEHWMPLSRAAMHAQGEEIHVAAWPTVRETYAIASRHYAFEGRCHVLAAGTIQHRNDLLAGLGDVGGDSDARALLLSIPDEYLQFGGSMIIAPDAVILAQAGSKEELLIAEYDPAIRQEELSSLDSDGHYSRPDIFHLRVDERAQTGLEFTD